MADSSVMLEKEAQDVIVPQLQECVTQFTELASSFARDFEASNWGGSAGDMYKAKVELANSKFTAMASELASKTNNAAEAIGLFFNFDVTEKSTTEINTGMDY